MLLIYNGGVLPSSLPLGAHSHRHASVCMSASQHDSERSKHHVALSMTQFLRSGQVPDDKADDTTVKLVETRLAATA